MNSDALRLHKSLLECQKHIERLTIAYEQLIPLFPLTTQSYQLFNDVQLSYLDQYLYRFAKLQDSLGQKVFKAVLLYKKEDLSDKAFIDIVNRLHQLNYIDDTERWFELRLIRNQLAHDYEDNSEELVIILNKIFSLKNTLENYYVSIYQKLFSSINELSK